MTASVVYLFLGYSGGNWLDRRFGTVPVFLVVGLLAAVGMSLRSLFDLVLALTADLSRARGGTDAANASPKGEQEGEE